MIRLNVDEKIANMRLQAHFKRRLAEAKSVVPDDPIDETNPRIKLKLGMSKTPEPRLTLKFAGQKSSSVEDKTPVLASLDSDSVQRPGSAAHRDTPDSSRLGGLGQSPMPGKIISPSPSLPSTAGAGLLNPSIGGNDPISSWPVVPQRPSYASVQSLFRKPDEGRLPLTCSTLSLTNTNAQICRRVRRIDQKPDYKIALQLGPSSQVLSARPCITGDATAVDCGEYPCISELRVAVAQHRPKLGTKANETDRPVWTS